VHISPSVLLLFVRLIGLQLRHYAGDVNYDVTGFLEKNRDTLFGDLILAMQTSKLPLLQKLFPDAVISKQRPVCQPTIFFFFFSPSRQFPLLA
jgi:myosin heavy subunit